MDNQNDNPEAPVAPKAVDAEIVGHGQLEAGSAVVHGEGVVVDRAKGALPATIDGAIEDLLVRDSRKYLPVAIFRFVSVWSRYVSEVNEKNAQQREQIAQLTERSAADKKHRPLRHVALLLGSFLGGLSLEEFVAGRIGIGIALVAAAALLIGTVAFTDRNERNST